MNKILLILGMLVQWTSISYSQEVIGMSNGFDFNLNLKNLENYNIVRTDENGKVVWSLSIFNNNIPFDSSQENYVVFGFTEINNGKIKSNPADYDYWLVPRKEEILFNAYPNPSLGFFNIYTNFIDNESEFQIYDEMNRVIYFGKIDDYTININLSNQSKGMYFIKFYNKEKILKTEKICLN